jgi:hypothetical protein
VLDLVRAIRRAYRSPIEADNLKGGAVMLTVNGIALARRLQQLRFTTRRHP